MTRRRAVRVVIVALVLLAGIVAVAYAASVGAPRATASSADLIAQQRAAERDLERIYGAAVDQLKTTRSLKLAIPDAQAAQIESKYTDQLKALRQSALVAVAQAYGLPQDQQQVYAQQVVAALEAGPLPSATPVMLAPQLYQIVQRMGELAGQLVDAGVKEMTQSLPSSSPTATSRPSASPSPTR